jgi:hypothetical protein
MQDLQDFVGVQLLDELDRLLGEDERRIPDWLEAV